MKEDDNNFLESNGHDEELMKLAEKAQIHPMLPRNYNWKERAELREFEKELLKGKEKDIER